MGCMNTASRWLLLVLAEIVVLALFGSVVGWQFGGWWHTFGYYSGWVGPVTALVLVGYLLAHTFRTD